MQKTIDFTLLTEKLLTLAQYDRYLAAFVFELKDPFIKVIVDAENCINLSHLQVGESIIGISFVSFDQFEDALKQRQKKNQRPSMLDDVMIVFDKTGKLEELQKKYTAGHPREISQEEYQEIRFTLLHADNKIRFALSNEDRLSASLGMHTNINSLLKVHYSLHTNWFKSDKRLMDDMSAWDPVMYELLSEYLTEGDVNNKFAVWSKMIAHTLQPIGGVLTALENNCDCENCSKDLSHTIGM